MPTHDLHNPTNVLRILSFDHNSVTTGTAAWFDHGGECDYQLLNEGITTPLNERHLPDLVTLKIMPRYGALQQNRDFAS
jgi:hypothetical protein